MSTETQKVELPSVTVAGRTIRHNDKKWRVATNRHSNTDGSRWGWIEGAPGNECWSDNEIFNSIAAGEAVEIHNQWIEDQVPVVIRLINACEKQNAIRSEHDRAKASFESAKAKLEQIDREVIQLSLAQAELARAGGAACDR